MEFGVDKSLVGLSISEQCSTSGEALVEWNSFHEQVDNEVPYWDTDDYGLGPSSLYGVYRWKIDNFSKINKNELRSEGFYVGGHKWNILIYPQGCDVCNNISLFLCAADHDYVQGRENFSGWSHVAQFTIGVVNKNPRKSKYFDTLHRFWKKEHDWGWKKLMHLSQLSDGFIEADTLIIKAQIQVIRKTEDRPFRCLDNQYLRELVRVYLMNVKEIFCRFAADKRRKLGELLDNKTRILNLRTFWLGTSQNARCDLSREKSDLILKNIVKHFFIEKEVTSSLVMDPLYHGLKALEGRTKGKKRMGENLNVEEELPFPIVWIEKDTFILADDILLLIQKVASEIIPPKDEKGLQTCTKEPLARFSHFANNYADGKDSIEGYKRHITELGSRIIEIFALDHIFSSKIEVACQEAIACSQETRNSSSLKKRPPGWLIVSRSKM